MRLSQFIILILTFSRALHASEVDHFTNRYPLLKPDLLSKRFNPNSIHASTDELKSLRKRLPATLGEIPDGTEFLNNKMNSELDRAAAAILKSKKCDADLLEQSILELIGGSPTAEIERWDADISELTFNPAVPIYVHGNVYAGTTAMANCCGSLYRINGHLVGDEKLGHFLVHGYGYFEIFKRGQKRAIPAEGHSSKMDGMSQLLAIDLAGEDGALTLGERKEAGPWGLQSSGVYSHADLVANYEGLQFWQQLTSGKDPYFVCDQGKWRRVRAFDWKKYVSDGWDEGINCSKFRSESFEETVASRIEAVQKASGKRVTTCPVEPEKCAPLAKRFGDKAERLLSPKCLAAAKGEAPTAESAAVKSESRSQRRSD